MLSFYKSSRSTCAIKSPTLVGFIDGSSVAMADAMYIRWMCYKNASGVHNTKITPRCSQDSDYNPELHEIISILLTSKARVAPMN